MAFNGGTSTWDFVTTADSYGRPRLQQKRQGPQWTTFDTTATSYDSAGRVASTSQPATCAMGVDCTTIKTIYTYDGANRPFAVTAADGGSVTYAYNLNDVMVTIGPDGTPTSRNLEYDALGRLTSVCEATSLGSSGACNAQSAPPAQGYMTTYTYDPLGNLTNVTQGATQARAYGYDGLSRLLSENNPESGTVT